MGFVTWGTLKAEVLPTVSKLFFIESETLSDLTALSAALLRDRIPDDCVILNAVNFAAAFADSAEEEQRLRRAAAPWTLLCRVCGYERYPERRLAIYENYLTDACTAAGLRAAAEPSGMTGMNGRVSAALDDCDRRETYWKLRRGSVREILFLAPPSRAADCVGTMTAALGAFPAEDLGITVQPQVQGRAFRVECDLFHAPASAAAAEAAAEGAERALFSAGAYFDLPYTEMLSGLVYAASPESTDTLRKLKDIFDPAHILNPGKLCF